MNSISGFREWHAWCKKPLAWLAAVTILAATHVRAAECPPLSKDAPQRITQYLEQRLVSGTGLNLSIASAALVPGSCYRKIVLAAPGRHDITMYLSPDERFLSPTLYDLNDDPQKEVLRIAQNVETLLLRDEGDQGALSTELTMVEFADYECPFCKQLAEWYDTLPGSLREKTKVIIKHLPLPQHPWAKVAAAYAACTKRQSSPAFAQLSVFLLTNQNDINPGNIAAHIRLQLSKDRGVNVAEVETCVNSGWGSAIIERDGEIARQLNVTGTPTLFVNGKRVLVLHSAEELQRVLEGELHALKSSTGERPSASQ